jgi:hypothetical protein
VSKLELDTHVWVLGTVVPSALSRVAHGTVAVLGGEKRFGVAVPVGEVGVAIAGVFWRECKGTDVHASLYHKANDSAESDSKNQTIWDLVGHTISISEYHVQVIIEGRDYCGYEVLLGPPSEGYCGPNSVIHAMSNAREDNQMLWVMRPAIPPTSSELREAIATFISGGVSAQVVAVEDVTDTSLPADPQVMAMSRANFFAVIYAVFCPTATTGVSSAVMLQALQTERSTTSPASTASIGRTWSYLPPRCWFKSTWFWLLRLPAPRLFSPPIARARASMRPSFFRTTGFTLQVTTFTCNLYQPGQQYTLATLAASLLRPIPAEEMSWEGIISASARAPRLQLQPPPSEMALLSSART